jgi:glycerol-3-phosphate O-acyltransferase
LRVALARQRAAAIGPDLSHRRTIVTQVLRAGAVRRAMADEMRTKKISRREALKLGQDYAAEIAANYSHVFVAIMARVLTWFWTRLYDGVELHHFDQLQKLADGNEIVYVPCHRSHIDYLLLSYAIYYKGYAVPHVAAGINSTCRCSGRFIRKGRRLLHPPQLQGQHAVHDGVHEVPRPDDGARSLDRVLHRGRPQPHRAATAAENRHAVDDPCAATCAIRAGRWIFLPVYFGYERLVEGKTVHRRAVRRGEGKGIGVHAAAHAAGAAAEDSAKVHVSFGEAVRLDDIMRKHAPDWQPAQGREGRPARLARRRQSTIWRCAS